MDIKKNATVRIKTSCGVFSGVFSFVRFSVANEGYNIVLERDNKEYTVQTLLKGTLEILG